MKLFAGKYIVFGSRNGTSVVSVGIYPDDLFGEDEAECLRNLAAAARRASWDESSDDGEEKDDTESRREEKEGNLGHESGQ